MSWKARTLMIVFSLMLAISKIKATLKRAESFGCSFRTKNVIDRPVKTWPSKWVFSSDDNAVGLFPYFHRNIANPHRGKV